MINFGAVPANSVLPIVFDSFAGSTGASITLSGLAVTDIEVYKGTSMTQRSSDAGYTLLDTDGIDIDGTTGIHGFSIDTSDNTDAGFYSVGSFFTVVVSAVTIDTQTVNFVAATFRLVAAENTAGTPVADTVRVAGTAQTAGDICGKIGTPSDLGGGATLAFNLSDIEAQTDDIGTAGAGLTAVPWNASWDAEVQSEVEDALVVHRLDELLNADSDIDGAAPPTVGSVFHELMTKTTGSFTYDQTTDSLEAIRDRGDAAWTTATGFSTHTAADVWAVATRSLTVLDEDSTTLDLDATIRAAVGLAAADLDTQLSTIDNFLDTEIAAIKAKTDQLTFTTANQVDATTVTVATGAIGTGDIAAAALNEIADAILDRNMATGTDSGSTTVRTLRQAARALRNKVSISGGTATITKEDDTTSDWTAVVTTTPGDPISAVDPAGP